MPAPREVRVLRAADHGPPLPIVEGEGSARPIVWPGVGAAFRALHRIELAAGSRTVPLKHAMEAAYYVIRGAGRPNRSFSVGSTQRTGSSMASASASANDTIRSGASVTSPMADT